MDLRNLLDFATRWGVRRRRARRVHAARSAHPAAVRVRRTTNHPTTRQPARLPSRLLLLGSVALLLLLGALLFLPRPEWLTTDGWDTSLRGNPLKQVQVGATAQSCQPSDQSAFTLLEIPAGRYALPTPTSGLYPFTRTHQMEHVVINTPFLIQERPVSRALFKQYAEAVASSADGEEKERLSSHLGPAWNRETAGSVVKGVSLEAAIDFGQWLSQKSGCSYAVPSREEWLATVVHLFNSGAPLPKSSDAFDATPLKSLLQGGSEWTRSPCALGHYLVGEEDWGVESKSREPVCMPAMFAVAGFRVVLHPDAQPAGGVNVTKKPTIE
ncbi:MAG: SUMF1/EgtB/PvdO family nonheme iron enzyme [Magnetococcus sp. YQC-3]